MDANTPASIPDLYTLQLVDGLAAKAGTTELRYRVVKLRETNVNDEREAVRLAERVVHVGGQPRLLVSDSEFRLAMTMRHVEALQADATQTLAGALLDLNLFGMLSSHDLNLIERRVFLITLAAQVRYGLISQAEFDQVMAGGGEAKAPQPVGQAPVPAAGGAAAESGPALLTDFAGSHADRAPAGDGR